MRRKLTARRMLIDAFHYAGYICPEAGRQASRMRAEDAFRRHDKDDNDFISVIRLGLTQEFLKMAGYDIRSDAPYKEVLGLEGGRQEFEALMPEKYRTAQYLPSLEPGEPT